MLTRESKVQLCVKCLCLQCCVKLSMYMMQTVATSTPRAAGSSATESALECSTRQAEPAAGTNTSKWENNSAVQSVRVILTLRAQDYLRMRHIFFPFLPEPTLRGYVCSLWLGVFRVVTCSLVALISSSSCCLLWPPCRWSCSFRDCSWLDMVLSTSIAYTHINKQTRMSEI